MRSAPSCWDPPVFCPFELFKYYIVSAASTHLSPDNGYMNSHIRSVEQAAHSCIIVLFLGSLLDGGLLFLLLGGLLGGLFGDGGGGGGSGGGSAEVEEVGDGLGADGLGEHLGPVGLHLHAGGLHQGTDLVGGHVLAVVVEHQRGVGAGQMGDFLLGELGHFDTRHWMVLNIIINIKLKTSQLFIIDYALNLSRFNR